VATPASVARWRWRTREGADVAFTHRAEEKPDAEQTIGLIEAAGRRHLALEADLRERAVCDRVVGETVEQLGRLDVLVNNAGFQWARDDGVEAIDDERLDRVFRTNLYALFWMTRARPCRTCASRRAESSTTRRSRRMSRRRRSSTTPPRRPRSTT